MICWDHYAASAAADSQYVQRPLGNQKRTEGASNRLIDVKDLTEAEIEVLHQHYQKLVALAKHDSKLTETHSIEEAEF